jgi:flagellar hook-length control protein FliK
VVESDASTIDADVATEDGKAGKTGAKSRSTSSDSTVSSTDVTSLAMLLAASGVQVHGQAVAGQQTDDSDADSSNADGSKSSTTTDANAASEAIAVGALAVSAVVGSLTIPGTSASPVSANVTSATVSSVASAAGSTEQADASVLATLSDVSSAGGAQLQTKSAPDNALQPVTSTGPAGLPEMIRAANSAPLQSTSVERSIETPVSDRNWSGAVAGQVQWMVNNNVQSATLQLSPEHLGPLEVHIDVQSSQVNVTFSASHADTRSALEQSVPRLREIMASGGLTLGQTSVQQETRSGSQYTPALSRGTISIAQNVDSVSISATRAIGLIDEYV